MIANGWKNTYYYQPYWWMDDYYVEWGASTGAVSYNLIVYADSLIYTGDTYYSLISTAVTE